MRLWYKLSKMLRNARRYREPRMVIHQVRRRHRRGHVSPYLCSSSPSDPLHVIRQHLAQVPFNRVPRDYATWCNSSTQCTAICKRSPLQLLAQLSPAIDSQYRQSPQSRRTLIAAVPLSSLSRPVSSTRHRATTICRSRFYDDIARDCVIPERERKRERQMGP